MFKLRNYLLLIVLLFSGCGANNMVEEIGIALAPMNHFKYGYNYKSEKYNLSGECDMNITAKTMSMSVVSVDSGNRDYIELNDGIIKVNGSQFATYTDLNAAMIDIIAKSNNPELKCALSFPLAMSTKGNDPNFAFRYAMHDMKQGGYSPPIGNVALGVRFYDSLDEYGTGFDKKSGGYIDYAGLEPEINGTKMSKLRLYGISIKK